MRDTFRDLGAVMRVIGHLVLLGYYGGFLLFLVHKYRGSLSPRIPSLANVWTIILLSYTTFLAILHAFILVFNHICQMFVYPRHNNH